MKLPSKKELGLVLKQHFPVLSSAERNSLASQISTAVAGALKMEKVRQRVPNVAARTRQKRISRYRKTLTAINNANDYLNVAVRFWNRSKISHGADWFADLLGAQQKLKNATASIEYGVNSLYSSSIHPAVRGPHEKPKRAHAAWKPIFGGHRYPLPHLRARAVDHQLISSLDSILQSVQPIAARRHALICRILEQCAEYWEGSRVKTILVRQRKSVRHRVKFLPLL